MFGLFAHRARRRLLVLLLCTEFLWGIGTYFVLTTTTVPSYLRALGASPAIIGVLVALMGALMLLLQPFGRGLLERFHLRKRGLIVLHVISVSAYPLIAALDLWLMPGHPRLMIGLAITLLACAQLVLGLVVPLWMDMVAQVIPVEVRGSYFGISSASYAVGGIVGAKGLMVLQHGLGDAVFRGAFLTGGVFFLLSMACFAGTPVAEAAFAHPVGPSVLTRLRTALRACRPGAPFGRLVLSYLLQALAGTILPFLVLYATDARGLHLDKGIFSAMTLWQALGGAISALILGMLVDRFGPRWPWVGVTLLVPLIVLLFPHASLRPVLVLGTLLVGVLGTHWSVGGPALLELSPTGDKSSYIAIANLASVLPTILGPLLMAALIAGVGYPAAFLAALLAGACAFLTALTIRDRAPRLSAQRQEDFTPPAPRP